MKKEGVFVEKNNGAGGGGGEFRLVRRWESDIKMDVTDEGREVWTGLIWLRRGASLGFL